MQEVHFGMDFVRLAADQQSDPQVQAYRMADSSLKIDDVRFTEAGVKMMCDVSRGHPHPVLAMQWRRRVFDMDHSFHTQGGELRRIWSHRSMCGMA